MADERPSKEPKLDVTPYVEGLRSRAKLWAAECETARQNARKDAQKMASFLAEAGATRVILFGSLARGDGFTPQSDIDLATEGLDWPTYWRTLSALHRMSEFNVDLVILEDAEPEFRQRIVQGGEDLLQ